MNLLPYCAEIAVFVLAGAALPLAFRLRNPRVLLAYWQCLLAICLIVPFLQTPRPAGSGGFAKFTAVASAAVPHQKFPQAVPLIVAAGIVIRLGWLAVGLWSLASYADRQIVWIPDPSG